MKHSIIYKNKDRYASFPLLEKMEDQIRIGFFTAPVPDHMGIFNWNVFESFNNGETWTVKSTYDKHSISPREMSDRFVCKIDNIEIITGSYGFKIINENQSLPGFELYPRPIYKIHKSKSLFYRRSSDNWHSASQRFYEIPGADIVLTFPRAIHIRDYLILVPAYALFPQYDMSRCFVWRSEDAGKTFNLWNMFPGEVDGNEMAFVLTEKGILAHIRSDKHPYLMESWSYDSGMTWTYPTNVYFENGNQRGNIIGGPPHLLRLKDNKILCTYGYRRNKMGIRAIISVDEGYSWSEPIVLRDDGGYRSNLHKRKLRNKFKLASPANDIGYPVSIQLFDKSILTTYYITNADQITHIAATKWEIEAFFDLQKINL